MKVLSVFLGRDKGQVPSVIGLIENENIQVACFQEVMEGEVRIMEEYFKFVRFLPMTRFHDGRLMGMATCTNLPVLSVREYYFVGNATRISQFMENSPEVINRTKRRPVLVVDAEYSGTVFSIGNCHFPYARDGGGNEDQFNAVGSLSDVLKKIGPHVLCGAMVCPRDRAIYNSLLREGLVDCVPGDIDCTLDLSHHKLAPLIKNGSIPRVVVDFVWLYGNPNYECNFVGKRDGIADHTPLVAKFTVRR
jgi:hypothetical protein